MRYNSAASGGYAQSVVHPADILAVRQAGDVGATPHTRRPQRLYAGSLLHAITGRWRPHHAMHRILIVCLLLACGLGGCSLAEPSAETRQLVFVIPPGTVARQAAGEQVSILPDTITLTLGQRDTLVIRNDDSQPVQIGPFKIAPGQRFEQQYFNRGTFDLVCTLHQTQRLKIVIE